MLHVSITTRWTSLFRYLLSAALVGTTAAAAQAAIITTPGLTTVRVWETTGPTTPYDFAFNGPQMTTQLGVGVLGPNMNDFSPLSVENYDVFYSDANGSVNLNGDYVTVEAVYSNSSGGGGLNLAAVDLLIGSTTQRADILASSVGLGPNFLPASVTNAVDADSPLPATFTSMGSTVTPPAQHLRVTVGWSRIPEPSSGVLAILSLVAFVVRRRA